MNMGFMLIIEHFVVFNCSWRFKLHLNYYRLRMTLLYLLQLTLLLLWTIPGWFLMVSLFVLIIFQKGSLKMDLLEADISLSVQILDCYASAD